ncbi:hypothetical protein [Methanobrevibacter sp. DSM 116169]|uniref:hypothetical protein n=1 Tax=Methanobrevibacter sp. DSM 116169 TaxID=3242727 RepID=UPI0038FD141E
MKDSKIRTVKVLNTNESKKHIILEDDDSFDENDSVVVLDINDYEKLKSKADEFENKFNNLQSELLDEKNKIQNLQDKINSIDDERVDIYKELDYKNKMILAYNVEMNKTVYDIVETVIDEARRNINERNFELVNEINKNIDKSKIEVNERNKAIAFDINKTVDEINEEIRNTNVFKMMLYKNKINLKVSTNDLIKPFEFDFDPNDLISSKNLELDTNEIIKKVNTKLPQHFSKYIESSDDIKD